jgi:signal transduction histidine kinase
MRERLRWLTVPSVRRQLAGWLTVVTLLSTAIIFVAVYRGTGERLSSEIDQEVSADTAQLAHHIQSSSARTPAQLLAVGRLYVSTRPFSASSTLMLVTVPGAGTTSNQPEIFAHAPADEGESVQQQEQENRLSGRLLTAPYGFSTVPVEDVGSLRLNKQAVRTRLGLHATVAAGEPLVSVAHAQRGVARAFILAALLGLAGALLASLLIASRVSRPLRRMAAVAARVDAGDLYPRMHHEGREGQEVRVLTDSFNHMLDRLSDAFDGQRAFVADASHELRTPLTVIRGQIEVLASQREPSGEEVRRVARLVQAEIARVSRLVDDLLVLAKSEQGELLRTERVELPVFVSELWDGMSLIADRRFELAPVPEGTLTADPDRLAQALRNLVSNAIEHTEPGSGLVRMNITAGPRGRVRFAVQDDGPGIPADQRERVFHRFHRTDHARDRASGGAGLGLAIVRAIADAHGGIVSAGESPEGGASIELELPSFTPAPARAPAAGVRG